MREMKQAFIALVLATAPVVPVHASDLEVLSAASMQTVFREVLAEFERRSGYGVRVRYSTMGAITERVVGGEEADLIISSTPSVAALVKRGKVRPGSEVTLAKTGVGIVVPTADVAPRIDSEEDFKKALLAARVIVYANPAGGGAAGIHIGRLIQRLGLADELRSKTRFGAGGDVAEVTIAEGSGALGLTQVSEIVGKPGMQFVAMPEALQNYTGFVAGIPESGKSSEAAKAFIDFLRTPEAIAVMKAKGMRVD